MIDAGNLLCSVVGELLPPIKLAPLLGCGKIPPYLPPATNKAAAFGEIMQSGIVFWGRAAGNDCLPEFRRRNATRAIRELIRDASWHECGNGFAVVRGGKHRASSGAVGVRVLAGQRNGQVQEAAVDLFAPLLVVEEEGGMVIHPWNLAADVEAVNVVA